MGISNLDPGARERRPWNAGSLVGAKRPLKPRDVWAIRFYLDEHRRMRDRALFDLAIDSKLRGCDVIKLKIALLSLDGVTQAQEDAFNRLTGKEYARIRDFLILHYNSTTRDDSPFWNYCRNMPVPDSLTEKVELFRQNGQIFREDDELFTETSWAAVMMGQGIKMGGHNAMADAVSEPNTRREIDEMEKSIQFVVQHMPSHGEYLNRYCPAPA